MDEELKSILKENLEVSRESLVILKKLNRARIISGILDGIKWVIILAVTFGTYYYLQPFLEKGIQAITNPAGLLDDTLGGSKGSLNLSPESLRKLKDAILKQ